MTDMTPEQMESLRKGFKVFNRFMLLMWRLGFGPLFNIWPSGGGQIMVITHFGRKSGYRYRTPVNYAVVGGDIYCLAGFGRVSDWYRNLIHNPHVEVWLPDGWWAGVAEEVNDPDQRLPLLRQVIIASGFAGPLFGVNARKMSDEEFTKVTSDYKLLRIRRTEARTGPGGPGDLAWIWPLATFLLLPLALRRRRKS